MHVMMYQNDFDLQFELIEIELHLHYVNFLFYSGCIISPRW